MHHQTEEASHDFERGLLVPLGIIGGGTGVGGWQSATPRIGIARPSVDGGRAWARPIGPRLGRGHLVGRRVALIALGGRGRPVGSLAGLRGLRWLGAGHGRSTGREAGSVATAQKNAGKHFIAVTSQLAWLFGYLQCFE